MAQDIFVGREDEQEQYRDFLTREEPWMLLITGLGGIGKSRLLRHLAEQTPPHTCVVTLNFAEEILLRTDPIKLLEALSLLLQPYTDAQQYDMFLESVQADHNQFEHYQMQMQQLAQSSNATQAGGTFRTATISMSDDTSAFLQQVHQAAREIQHQMWAIATDAFFMQLDTLRPTRSVFMFDTCELLNEPESWEVSQWLMNDFLPRLHLHTQRTEQPCFVVMASRVSPQSEVIDDQEQRHIVLSMLDKQAADEYLELVGIDDPVLRQRIYQITHGHALCISILGAFYQGSGQLTFNTTDLSLVQQEFDEHLSIGFINDRILNNLASPFKELTQYGVLLRNFTLPLLKAVFPELLPEPTARYCFEQFIRYPYIESLGNYRYGFHELVREVLAKKTQKEHPEEWKRYHKNALDYFAQGQVSSQPSTHPIEWYYHTLAYSIACGKEEEGIANWREALQEAHISRTHKAVNGLLQIAYDHALELTPASCAVREFEQGRSYYYIQQWEAALKSYEQALWFFEQVRDRLGQAIVAKAMGDVQRAQARLDTAQQSYQKAIVLYEAEGNRSGQAKVFQALGSIKQSRHELDAALDNYEVAFRLFRQEEDQLGQADVCKAIGDVQRASEKREEALQSYSQAIALYEDVGSDRGKLEAERARDELYALIEIKRTRDQAHFVYVSASRADSEIAEHLKADLQTKGIAVWTEQERIHPGTLDWEEGLRSAIRGASAVVLVASPNARASRSVKETMRIAEMYQRPVYPVWVRGDQWIEAAPQSLIERQYIDAREVNYLRALNEITAVLSWAPLTGLKLQEGSVETLSPLGQGVEPRNPYKGLRAFTSNDFHDFFGRDTLVNELVTTLKERLTGEKERLLAVVGPSGSGKSSVVMAGLLPRLQAGVLPRSDQWIYLEPMVPGKHALEALGVTLAERFPEKSLIAIQKDLEDESAQGLHLLATALTKGSGAKVVLFVDQFEELFTQTASEDERRHFIDLLVTAILEPHGPAVVILTLRADFYDRPMLYPVLGRILRQTHSVILPMDLKDLRAVIERPAVLPDVQVVFEDDLVSDLLFEIQGQAGALPLLQFTLDQLFQRRSGRQLTLQAYREIGGVKGALAKHAEDTYISLPSDEHRKLARALFLRLIDPGITEQETTRRRAALTELSLPDSARSYILQQVSDAFITARLLVINEIEGITTIEVSHEALIREWTRLMVWLREAREDIPIQQAVSKDVAEWEMRGKPKDRLYRGTQLKEAQAWAAHNVVSEKERAFLSASTARRTQSIISGIVIVFLLLSTSGLAGYLFLRSTSNRVTNLSDDGLGSLRQTIAAASSGSTITFDPGLQGTIKLANSLAVNKALTILGLGADRLAISSGNTNLTIYVFNSASLTISGLSFKGSKMARQSFILNEGILRVSNSIISGNSVSAPGSGGGITNSGTLTLSNSTVSSNTAQGDGGGITNSGTLTLSNSTVSGNTAQSDGGGITNSGTLTLSNSVISGNSANDGGGITNSGTLTLSNSTVSGNTAQGDGGGITNSGTLTLSNSVISGNSANDGGGIYNSTATAMGTVTNSTISGNAAQGNGSAFYNQGKLMLTNSTVSGNAAQGNGGAFYNTEGSLVYLTFCTIYDNIAGDGGGIAIAGGSSVTMRNSIVAGNRAQTNQDISGPLISGGYNLIQNVSGANIIRPQNGSTDLIAVSPNVGSLQNNGGPTGTLALLAGSPAIDKIPLASCHVNGVTSDQRGIKRPDGNELFCDIGAYENTDPD
jgi:tetratricopeptide (TPR) repeat protein/energy-coupling factor transporter ATP-binding protein EcfA2